MCLMLIWSKDPLWEHSSINYLIPTVRLMIYKRKYHILGLFFMALWFINLMLFLYSDILNLIRFAQPFYSGKGVLKYFGLTVQLNLIKKSLLTTNLILTLLHLASNIFALPKKSRSDALVGWSCQVLLQVINLALPVLKEHLISANRWPSNAWSWVYSITVLVSTVNMKKYFVTCKGGCDGWKLISSQNQIRSTSSGINWLIRPNSPRVMRILAGLNICVIWLTPFKGKLM
jgi:hypothetical protein